MEVNMREINLDNLSAKDLMITFLLYSVSRISFSVSFSSLLNSASPEVSKISATVHPHLASISSSRSTKGQQSSSESILPTLLLPHPINPVNDTIIKLQMSRFALLTRHDRRVRTMTIEYRRPMKCRSDHLHPNCRSLLPDSLLQTPLEVHRLPACEAVR